MGEPGGLRLRSGGPGRSRAGTVPLPGPDEAGRAGVPRREAALLRGRLAGGERDARQWTYKPRHPGCHTPLSGADSPEDGQTRCVTTPPPAFSSHRCHLSSVCKMCVLICDTTTLFTHPVMSAEPHCQSVIISRQTSSSEYSNVDSQSPSPHNLQYVSLRCMNVYMSATVD